MSGLKRPKTGGMRKGYKAPGTLDKLAAREYVRQTVIASLAPMIEAQVANASGLKYLIVRDKKTGKFLRLTEDMAATLMENDPEEAAEAIEVWEKDPNVNAFADLLNRALGKPTDHVEMEVTTNNALDERLKNARTRVGKRS